MPSSPSGAPALLEKTTPNVVWAPASTSLKPSQDSANGACCGSSGLGGGVVTGRVALLYGADEGLVAGDIVNVASRIQSTAEPGSVLVDDVTMRATRATLAYAPAGEHQLKGLPESIPLW